LWQEILSQRNITIVPNLIGSLSVHVNKITQCKSIVVIDYENELYLLHLDLSEQEDTFATPIAFGIWLIKHFSQKSYTKVEIHNHICQIKP
jgi:pentose-5-phosphate-3-epimerase